MKPAEPEIRLDVDLRFDCKDWRSGEDPAPLIHRAAKAAHAGACRNGDCHKALEVVIVLSDDRQVRALNKQYRDQDKATNILSFPFKDDFPELAQERFETARPLGDLVLAFETTSREARELRISFGHHLAHLVVHGVLHLFGHDHVDNGEAEIMETLEREILAELDIPSPYPDL